MFQQTTSRYPTLHTDFFESHCWVAHGIQIIYNILHGAMFTLLHTPLTTLHCIMFTALLHTAFSLGHAAFALQVPLQGVSLGGAVAAVRALVGALLRVHHLVSPQVTLFRKGCGE